MFLSSLGESPAAMQSQVYTCTKKTTKESPCHHRVGKAYHLALKELRQGGDCFKPLEDIGVERYKDRQLLFRAILEKFSTVTFKPHNSECENSGIYVGDVGNEKFSVFKIGGTRRTLTEMLAETAADLSGLPNSISTFIPFVHRATHSDDKENAFSINIQDDKDDTMPLIETLWNGKEKEYEELPKLVLGGIQPFMADKSVTVEQYSEKVLLALVIGLRDGKELEWKRLSDVEDSFASRIDPPLFDSVEDFQENAVAATDLPFLKHDYSTSRLSKKQIAKLAGIVTKWDIEDICAKLGAKPILFYDRKAETFDEKAEGAIDECGTPFAWVDGEPHQIDGESYAVDVSKQQTILNKKQVAACKERMTRIRKFILEHHAQGKRFTSLDIVKAVDPFFQIYWDAIMRMPNRERVLGQTDPYTIIGRQPLSAMTSSLRCQELLPSLAEQMFDRTKRAFTEAGFVGLPPLPTERKDHLEMKSPTKTEEAKLPPKKPMKTITRARFRVV